MEFSDMDFRENDYSYKLNKQEMAQYILQIYVESLQDHNKLRNILSKCAILDYFGKFFYGRDEICKHLLSNLHGSSFELSSLIMDDEEASVAQSSICHIKEHQTEEELGVSLMAIPSSSFPGLSFTTPIGTSYCNKNIFRKSFGKRSQLDSSTNCLPGKKCEILSERNENILMQGLPLGNRNVDMSPENFESNEMRYISFFGTVYYGKQALSTIDPKRIKHHNIGTPRQRFCHLHINFKCDEHFKNFSNFKIWIIRYKMRSKMTPRNLLNSFTE